MTGEYLADGINVTQIDNDFRVGDFPKGDVLVRGPGTESWACYKPLYDKENLQHHHHSVGGGNYCATAYRELVEALRERYKSAGMEIMPGGERAHEQMIDTSHLSGRARVHPWDVTFHGTSLWVEGGMPIPLRPYLYHDWVPMTARMPRRANVYPVYVDAYRGGGQHIDIAGLLREEPFLALQRQRAAQWTVEGHALGFYLQLPAPGQEENRRLDGPPTDVAAGLGRNNWFLREMVRVRGRAARFLVDGRMLRPPVVDAESSMSQLYVANRQGLEPVVVPSVCASAWQSPDGEVGLVLANYAGEDARVRLSFDPAAWGLTHGKPIVLERSGIAGKPSQEPVVITDDNLGQTPWITLPVDEPTRVYVVREASAR